jgi:hypothetical protein
MEVSELEGVSSLDILKIEMEIPGIPADWQRACASIRLAPAEKRQLFPEYGAGSGFVFFGAESFRAAGAEARATLTIVDGSGRTRRIDSTGPIVSGTSTAISSAQNQSPWSYCYPTSPG